MPEVTVLTAVRNGMPYLPETIKSIQSQTFQDWEYILVDDASNDETPYILEQASKTDSRIHLLRRSKPGGAYIAANDGLRFAQGKYVARTDADDLSLPSRIETQLAFLKEHPKLRACASYAQAFDDKGLMYHRVSRPCLLPNSLKWELGLRNFIIHSTAFIERETLIQVYSDSPAYELYYSMGESIEPTSPKILPDGEDYRLWCRLSRLGLLATIPEILVQRRLHKNQITRTNYLSQTQMIIYSQIMREHLDLISVIGIEDIIIDGLVAVGILGPYPIVLGLQALNKWSKMIKLDKSVSLNEYNELRKLYNNIVLNFINTQLKRKLKRLYAIKQTASG